MDARHCEYCVVQWMQYTQFSSVTQSCLTLCSPMDHSTPGLPVHHQLPEFTQTHVYWVSDAIQPSHPLLSPSPQMSQFFASGSQSVGVSASASVLPMNIQDSFPLGWIGLVSLQSKRLSQESSPKPQFKSINSSMLSLLYGAPLTSIHDYWKNHSFDYMDLCQQSNVSAF